MLIPQSVFCVLALNNFFFSYEHMKNAKMVGIYSNRMKIPYQNFVIQMNILLCHRKTIHWLNVPTNTVSIPIVWKPLLYVCVWKMKTKKLWIRNKFNSKHVFLTLSASKSDQISSVATRNNEAYPATIPMKYLGCSVFNVHSIWKSVTRTKISHLDRVVKDERSQPF